MKKSVNFTGLISKGSAGYKKAKVGGILCVVGIFSVKLEVIPLIGLVCLVIGIILTVIAWKEHKKSVKDITDTIVKPMLEKTFPGSVYDPFCEEADTGIYTDLKVIRRDSTMSYTDFLSCTVDNHYFECIYLEASHSNDNNRVYTFRGNIYSCVGDRNIEGIVRIIPTRQGSIVKSNEYHTFAKCDKKSEVHIETGDEAFDSTFEVYASDMHIGHYVMNAHVKEKLVKLRETYGDYCVVVTGRDIYIAIKDQGRVLYNTVADLTIDDDTKIKTIQAIIKSVAADMLELQQTMSLHKEV